MLPRNSAKGTSWTYLETVLSRLHTVTAHAVLKAILVRQVVLEGQIRPKSEHHGALCVKGAPVVPKAAEKWVQ